MWDSEHTIKSPRVPSSPSPQNMEAVEAQEFSALESHQKQVEMLRNCQCQGLTQRLSFKIQVILKCKFCFKDFFFQFIFLVALGLHCCEWVFSSCGEWGLLFVAMSRLLVAVASFVQSTQVLVVAALWAQQLCSSLVAPWHVESSSTRNRTCVPCMGRQILIHCTIKEVLFKYPLQF